ncbi:MAG: hypothetical protein MJZ03_04030 [archaeon]|nr:hypothetical protein [archaeon]
MNKYTTFCDLITAEVDREELNNLHAIVVDICYKDYIEQKYYSDEALYSLLDCQVQEYIMDIFEQYYTENNDDKPIKPEQLHMSIILYTSQQKIIKIIKI